MHKAVAIAAVAMAIALASWGARAEGAPTRTEPAEERELPRTAGCSMALTELEGARAVRIVCRQWESREPLFYVAAPEPAGWLLVRGADGTLYGRVNALGIAFGADGALLGVMDSRLFAVVRRALGVR